MNNRTGSVLDSVHQWMGEVFYRGIDPSHMGYSTLSYYHGWHAIISETELNEAQKIRAAMQGG